MIRKDRVYHFIRQQGISGFQRWGVFDHGIARGDTVRARGLNVDHAESIGPLADYQWRLDDGHLPDYQPVVSFSEASDAIMSGRVREAFAVRGGHRCAQDDV
jgi:hypothetical protein